MSGFTKQTTIVWDKTSKVTGNGPDSPQYAEMQEESHNKIVELQTAGKMSFTSDSTTDGTTFTNKRFFSTTEAAQEWLDFSVYLSEKYNTTRLSATITDVV